LIGVPIARAVPISFTRSITAMPMVLAMVKLTMMNRIADTKVNSVCNVPVIWLKDGASSLKSCTSRSSPRAANSACSRARPAGHTRKRHSVRVRRFRTFA